MFLSVVSSTSKPSASAAASNSPFLSVSQPCCAAVRTSCPCRWGRMGTGVAWSNKTRMSASYPNLRARTFGCEISGANLRGEGRRFIETAGGKLDDSFDLFAIEAVIPLHDVVEAGARLEVFEDGGDRHPRALQHPRAAHLAGNALHRRTLRPIEIRHG